MSESNQTMNSKDQIFGLEKFPDNYNVRNNKTAKAVTGEKRNEYNLLEENRGLYAGELSKNYWLVQNETRIIK